MQLNSESALYTMVKDGEKPLWQGKPNKRCHILHSILNKIFFRSTLWILAFIITYEYAISNGYNLELDKYSTIQIVWGCLLGFLPVWLYLINLINSLLSYKNINYLITDKGVYCSYGAFSTKIEHLPFTNIKLVNLKRGIIDKKLGVGQVICWENPESFLQKKVIPINNIPDYTEVYDLVKKYTKTKEK